MSAELTYPPKFSGAAQLQLFTRYGDPEEGGFEEKWITTWEIRTVYPWFPAYSVRIHKHFKPIVNAAFRALEMAGVYEEIITFDEAFCVRRVKGSDLVLSIHSWGCAIDLNAALNPVASEGCWSNVFLEIMTAGELFCGQLWSGRKDPAHFAMVNG